MQLAWNLKLSSAHAVGDKIYFRSKKSFQGFEKSVVEPVESWQDKTIHFFYSPRLKHLIVYNIKISQVKLKPLKSLKICIDPAMRQLQCLPLLIPFCKFLHRKWQHISVAQEFKCAEWDSFSLFNCFISCSACVFSRSDESTSAIWTGRLASLGMTSTGDFLCDICFFM